MTAVEDRPQAPLTETGHEAVLGLSDALDAALAAARRREQAAYERGRADGYGEGRAAGYAWLAGELKRHRHRIVDDLALYRARWHVPCVLCRRRGRCPRPDPHGRCPCPGCEDRTQDTYGQPMTGDYAGGPAG